MIGARMLFWGKLSIILKNSLPTFVSILREKGGLNQVIWRVLVLFLLELELDLAAGSYLSLWSYPLSLRACW